MIHKLSIFLMLLTASLTSLYAGGQQESSVSSDTETAIIMHYMGEESKRNGLKTWVESISAANPGLNYEIEAVANGQYPNILKTRIASGDAPDILFGRPRQFSELVEGGAIKDLSDTPYIDRVVEMAIEEAKIDGAYYGIPVDLQPKGVFYNKRMFKEHNIEVPKTLDEFIMAAQKFQDKGIVPFMNAFGHGSNPWNQWDSIFLQMTHKDYRTAYTDVRDGLKTWGEQDVVREGMSVYAKILSFKDAGDFGIDQNQATLKFAAEERPMYINGGWIVGDLRAANPDGDFGFFGTPWSNDPAKNTIELGLDDCFMASATSKSPQAIDAFFDHITSQQGATEWMKNARMMSAIKETTTEGADPIIEDIGAYVASGNYASRSLVVEPSGELKTVFRSNLQYFAALDNDERDVDSFLERLDAETAAIR